VTQCEIHFADRDIEASHELLNEVLDTDQLGANVLQDACAPSSLPGLGERPERGSELDESTRRSSSHSVEAIGARR
jgi:hypothetical protein